MNVDNESVYSVESIENEECVEYYFDTLISINSNQKIVYNEIQEMCKQLCLKPNEELSDDEYFKSFVEYTKLPKLSEDTKEAVMTLLGHSLTKASVVKIRSNSGYVSKILIAYLSDEQNRVKFAFKNVILGLGKWFESLTNFDWNMDYTINCYNRLLSFTVDSKEIISKVARCAISSIFHSKKETKLLKRSNNFVKETITFVKRTFMNSCSIPLHTNIKKLKTAQMMNNELKIKLTVELIHDILKVDVLDVDVVNELVEVLMSCFEKTHTITMHCLCLDVFVDLYRYSILCPETSARTLNFLYKYIQSKCTKSISGVNLSPPSLNLFNGWLNAYIAGIESLIDLHMSGQIYFTDFQNNTKLQSLPIALENIKLLITFCSDWLLSDNKVVREVSNEVLLKVVSGKFITLERNSENDYLNDYDKADQVLVDWFIVIKRHMELPNLEYVAMVLNVLQCIVIRSGNITSGSDKIRHETLNICPYFAGMRDRYDQSETRVVAELVNVDQKYKKKAMNASIKNMKVVIESYIGSCIKIYGIRLVWTVLSLDDMFNMNATNVEQSNRTWLVPLMQRYIENCSPFDFQEIIMPFINKLTSQLDILSSTNNSDEMSSAESAIGVFRDQLWSTLPSFCVSVKKGGLSMIEMNPLLPSQFPYPIENETELKIVESGGINLYKLLVGMLDVKTPSNLESVIFKAFRNIIKSAEDQDEMKQVLTGFSFYPSIVLHCFNWYINPNCTFKLEIQIFLNKYIQLFDDKTFVPNLKYILNKKLSNVDMANSTNVTLSNLELLSILGPHMPTEVIGEIVEALDKFLHNDVSESVCHKIQKKCYRFFDVITASDTDNSCEYTKQNMKYLLNKLSGYTSVKSDSKKCRIKTLYNLFKLLNNSEDIRVFLNTFMKELIMGLTEKNLKTRSVSGYLFVESIVNSFDLTDCEEDELAVCVDKMLQHVLAELENKVADNSAQQYKSALSQALILLLCEQRLCRVVTTWHIEQVCNIVKEILKNHDSKATNRHMVHCALNIVKGLLKKKTRNVDKVSVKDICLCISSASEELRMKIRIPIKNIIKSMLRIWEYEQVKHGLPESLKVVVRNVHKALNRSNRVREDENDEEQSENEAKSCATSWIMGSEAGKSTMTMKKPEIRSIAELLEDSESEEEIEDEGMEVASRMSGLTMKSSKKSLAACSTTKSKVSKRHGNKRKFTEDDILPILEDGKTDIMDLQDPLSVNRVRYQDTVKAEKDAIKELQKKREITKKGFQIKDGKILIGQDMETKKENVNSDDECDENTRFAGPNAKKQRFERKKESKVLGKMYEGKKGVLGDVTKKGKMQPHALLFPADIQSGVYKNHQRNIKKAMRQTRTTSKKNNMKRARK